MNEKLRQIYELYRDNGLMGDATFEQFAQASPEQQQAIWQLGVDNGIMGEAGPEDFKSAFVKEETGFFAEDKEDEFAKVGQVIPDALKKKEPQGSTESPSEESSSALQSKPNVPLQTPEPEEKDYFEGAFGDVLRGFDNIVPLGIGDFVDDVARSVSSGYRQAKVAEEADNLLMSGAKATPEEIESFIEANKSASQLGQSKEIQDYTKTYEEEGKGFWGVVKGLAKNPTVIPEVLISSLTSLATNTDALKAGGAAVGTGTAYGATTGAAFGGVGALPGALAGATASIPYAFGLASSVVEAGSTFAELLQEQLGDKEMTKENVRELLENPDKFQEIRNKAIVRGIVIGAADAFTGKLASGVGAKILGKSAAKSVTGAATRGAVTRSTAAGAGIEALGGSLGEATARGVIGQDMDVSEIALEGLAELPGGVRSTIQARLAKPEYKVNGAKATKEEIDDLINTMSPADLQKTKIEIKNDYEGRQYKIEDKIITGSIKEQVRQGNPELNEPSLNAITELEKELKKLEGNTTQTGKDKVAAIRAQIKDIQQNQLQEEVQAATPSYSINGKEMSEQEFTKAVSEMSPEDVKKADIKANNATEGVTTLLKEVATRSGVDSAPMMETTAPAAPEAQPAKPKTLDEIEDEDLKSTLKFNKEYLEQESKLDEEDYNKAKENFDSKNPIVRFFSKKPSYEQYTKYTKNKLELLKNNPEQYISDAVKEYEESKKEYEKDGEEFPQTKQETLDYLKNQLSKLQEENAVQKPTTEEAQPANKQINRGDLKISVDGTTQGLGNIISENYSEKEDGPIKDKRFSVNSRNPIKVESTVKENGNTELNVAVYHPDNVGRQGAVQFKIEIPKGVEVDAQEIENIVKEKTKQVKLDPQKDGFNYKKGVESYLNDIVDNIIKPKENAVQKPTTEEGVLRTEQPEVGLPKMGEGNTQQATAQEGVANEKQKEVSGKPTDADYTIAEEVNNNVAEANPNASVLLTPKGNDLSLTAVYVKKENRGKGIGTKVLEIVKSEADRTGKKIVLDATNELDAETNLERLGNFYEKNGFKKVSENKFEYDPQEGVTPAKPQEAKPIEQELAELEQMFPTEGPTGKNKGVAASDTKAMEEIASRSTDERVQKVVKTAQKLTKTLKSLFPNAEINIHETEESYNGAMEEINATKESNGNFAFGVVDGKPFVRIDINANTASARDVAHEVAHAVLQKTFGDNQKLFQSFQEKIAKVISTDSNQKLLDFANNPKYKEQGVTYEEYMAELKAILSEEGSKIELSTAKKIAAVINEYVSRITKGAFKPFQEVTDVKQVVDFVNKVTEAMAKGEAIDVEAAGKMGEGSRSSLRVGNNVEETAERLKEIVSAQGDGKDYTYYLTDNGLQIGNRDYKFNLMNEIFNKVGARKYASLIRKYIDPTFSKETLGYSNRPFADLLKDELHSSSRDYNIEQIKDLAKAADVKIDLPAPSKDNIRVSDYYRKNIAESYHEGNNPSVTQAVEALLGAGEITSRSSLRTVEQVDKMVKDARASGYSEKAIEEFLKKRGVDQAIVDKSLGKKEAGTKIVTNEEMMPGYDKMMEDVNSEILRGLDRKTKETTIEKNVMKIVEGSEAYKNATDQQRNQMVRDVKEAFGEKMKPAPSAEKITGKEQKKVTVDVAQALKDQIKLEMKAALEGAKSVTEKIKAVKDYFDSVKDSGNLTRKDLTRVMDVIAKVKDEKTLDKAVNKINDIIDKATSDKIEISEKKMIANTIKEVKLAKGNIKEKRKLITDVIDSIKKSGKLTAAQVNALLKRANNLNVESFEHLNKFIDYAEKIFADADYQNKLSKANAIKDSIKKLSKNKGNKYNGNLVALGEEFIKIDPSLVEDIEQYNKIASDLEDAIKGSSMKGFKATVDIKTTNAYIEKTMKAQKEKLTDMMREQIEELLGVDGSTLTYDEMLKMLEKKEEDMSEQNEKIIRSAAVKLFESLSSNIEYILKTGKDPFTGEPVDINKSKEKVIRNFMEMDLTKMKIKDAISAVDALNNFIVNQSTAKMDKVFRKYRTERRIESLISSKIKSKIIRVYRLKKIGRGLFRYVGSETILMDALFGGTGKADIVSKAMGLSDIKSNKSEAETTARNMVVDYVDEFYDKKANGTDFNTAENNVERGILAFVSRVRFGDEKVSFEDRKSLVEQTIENLENGSEKEQEKAKLYQEAYDKILKDSKSAQEVRSKVDKVNADAVDFWVNKWSENYEELADVSENIHNVVLERDGFFTPDVVKRVEEYTDEKTEKEDMLDMTDSAFLTNSGIVKKKSGRLEKVTIKNKLPEGRYYDFSFDNNNASLMADALIDVKTAGNVVELSTFLNSPDFKKIVTTVDERNLLKERMEIMVRSFRNKNQYNYDEITQLVKSFNRINALGASYALGGLAAIPKQFFGPAVNTMIASGGNLPHFDVWYNKAKQDFIANSGESIANRGSMSTADIQNIDRLLQEAAKSTPEEALRLIEKVNKFYLKKFLVNTDVYIAKASWLTYYEKELRKKGVNTENIDYSKHKLDKAAAQYATRRVDRQQNISDEDLRGKVYSMTDGFSPIITKVLLPFASFRINQWLRMNTDIGTLTDKTATKEDKVDAAYSLAAMGAEVAVFNFIGYTVSAGLRAVATSVKRAITGDDDEEEKRRLKEEDEKYIKNLKKSKGAAVVQDYLSPLPPLDPAFEYIVYNVLDKLQSDTKEEDRINIFEPKPKEAKTLVDYVITNSGGAGIALDRANNFYKIADAYMNGQIETTQYGKTTVKNIREKDKKVLGGLTTLAFLNTIGVLPSEFNSIQNTMYKEIVKEASTKTEAEIIEDKANKRERIADKNEKIDIIDQALRKAPNQRVADELVKMKADAIEDLSVEEKSDEEKEALKKKRERERASYKNLLGGYDTKEDLKRYDPDLYENNFGEGSDYYKTHKYEQEAEKLLDKTERKNKDIEYNYQEPTKTKSRFFNSDGTTKRKSRFKRFSSN